VAIVIQPCPIGARQASCARAKVRGSKSLRWVGLVRNVMLGRDGLDRARLLDTVERAGGSQACSYLTTGNVTFDATASELDAVSRNLEVELSRIVSRPAMVAIREHGWLCDLVGNDLFSAFEAEEWEFEVAFLRHADSPIEPRSLPESHRTRIVAIYDRELVSARPRSGLARPHVNRLLERASGQAATARGWSTLRRIAANR
jgi:uncharacterized protein (DUF1697 family)